MSDSTGDFSEASLQRRYTFGFCLFAIMLIGLLLRLWGIEKESAWWDEYSSLVHLKETSLLNFLSANRTYDPATLPLYYAIEYLWSRIAGTDTVVMRIPSVIMGMATIPAVYALGRLLFTHRAGLLAAACVAVSPIHVFHAQGIRMYVLFTLLAVLSMLTYAQVRQTNGAAPRVGHGLVQLALSWTHPFAILIPLVQGMAWVLAPAKQRAGMIRWGLISALAWLPALLYLTTVRYYPEEITQWMQVPDLRGLFHDLFQDDIPRSGYQVHVSDRAWEWLPFGMEVLFQRSAILLDASLTFVFIGTLIVAVTLGIRERASGSARELPRWLLLAFWSIVPVLVLYLASLVIRPMIAPRYTVHCSIAFYLMIAGTIAMVPRRWRFPSELLVCLLMLSQVALLYPGPQRTNYLGAAKLIMESANLDTDLLIVTSSFERNTLEYNANFAGLPVFHVEGTVPAYLFATAAASSEVQTGKSAWIFHVIPYWYKHPDPHPAEVFPKLGMDFKVWDMSGMQGVRVVRVTRGEMPIDKDVLNEEITRLETLLDPEEPMVWFENLLPQTNHLPKDRLAGLTRDLCNTGAMLNSTFMSLVCGSYDWERPMSDARAQAVAAFLPVAWGTIDMNSLEAKELIGKALVLDSSYGIPQILKGFLATKDGNVAEAIKLFANAISVDPDVDALIGDFVRAVKASDPVAAEGSVKRIEESQPELGGAFREMLSILFATASRSLE